MIGMAVAEQDRRDAALGRLDDGLDMARIVRPGIEDDHPLCRLDQVGVGTVIGHQAGIGRKDAPDAWRDIGRPPALRFRLGQIGQDRFPGRRRMLPHQAAAPALDAM